MEKVYTIVCTTFCNSDLGTSHATSACFGVYRNPEAAKADALVVRESLINEALTWEDDPEENRAARESLEQGNLPNDEGIYFEYDNGYDDHIEVTIKVFETTLN